MKAKLVRLENQQEIAKAELEKPFVLDDELITKEARLTELNSQLSLDGEEEVEESAENKEHAKTEEASNDNFMDDDFEYDDRYAGFSDELFNYDEGIAI